MIAPNQVIGPVTLNVANLLKLSDFYHQTVGLEVILRDDGRTTLGAGGNPLLILRQTPGASRPPRAPGLYHVAYLLPSSRQLALTLRHLAETRVQLQGMADHLVSQAIYLADPEGNGIEIYCDRPRDQWQFENGSLLMTTEPLDIDALMSEIETDRTPWTGISPQTIIGHIHLKVSDLPSAEKFYREVIGFDLMTRYGRSASFLSTNGYHHHIGINTWESQSAPPASEGSLGLREFMIRLSDSTQLSGIIARVEHEKIPFEPVAHILYGSSKSKSVTAPTRGLYLRDPSGNKVLVNLLSL